MSGANVHGLGDSRAEDGDFCAVSVPGILHDLLAQVGDALIAIKYDARHTEVGLDSAPQLGDSGENLPHPGKGENL